MNARMPVPADSEPQAKRRLALAHLPDWPAGLRRPEAAAYVGVSPSKFDDWVTRAVMPRPKEQDGVVLWLRRDLDAALDAFSDKPDAAPKESPYRNVAL